MAVTNTTIDLINDTFTIDENSNSNAFNLFANDSGAISKPVIALHDINNIRIQDYDYESFNTWQYDEMFDEVDYVNYGEAGYDTSVAQDGTSPYKKFTDEDGVTWVKDARYDLGYDDGGNSVNEVYKDGVLVYKEEASFDLGTVGVNGVDQDFYSYGYEWSNTGFTVTHYNVGGSGQNDVVTGVNTVINLTDLPSELTLPQPVIDDLTNNPDTTHLYKAVETGSQHSATGDAVSNMNITSYYVAYKGDEDATVWINYGSGSMTINGQDATLVSSGVAVIMISDPANGTVEFDGGTATYNYKPNTDYSGSDSFTYTVSVVGSGVDTATVNVTVNAATDDTNAVEDYVYDSFVAYNTDGSVDVVNSARIDNSSAFIDILEGNGLTLTNLVAFREPNEDHSIDRQTITIDSVSFSGAVLATNVSMKVYIDFSTLEDTDNTNNQPTVVYSTGVESLTDYIPLLTAEQFTGLILGNYEADAGDETDAGETETDAAGIVHTETETLVDGILTVNETTTLGFDLTYTANTATFASTITGTYVASDGTTFTKVSAQATFNPTGGEDGEGNIEDAIGTALASTGESATFVSNSTNDGFVFTYTDSNNAVRVLTVTDDAVVISNTTTAEATTNTAPVTVGTMSDVTIEVGESVTLNPDDYFTDADGDALTYTVTIDGVFTQSWSDFAEGPDANAIGTKAIVVTADDGKGGTATQSFNATIVAAPVTNTAPVAVDDTYTLVEDGTVQLNHLSNDTDAQDTALEYANITYTLAPTKGTVDSTGLYTANADATGTDTITYTVKDSDGAVSNEATMTINITAVNDAPTGTVTTTGDATSGQTLTATNNLADVDGLGAITYTWTDGTDTLGTGATYTLTDAQVTKTISVTASYTDNDGTAESATATTTAAVAAAPVTNTAPVAVNDTATVDEDTTIDNINVLGNDTDAQNDNLTIKSASSTDGTVTINTDNTLKFVPNANFNGDAIIKYVANDGALDSNEATVTVTVNPVNDAPVAVGTIEHLDIELGESVTLNPDDYFTDADGDALTYTATVGADAPEPWADFVGGPSDPSAIGDHTIVITADDGKGGTATQSFNATIIAATDGTNAVEDYVYDPFVAYNEDGSVDVDKSARIDNSSAFIDILEGNGLTLTNLVAFREPNEDHSIDRQTITIDSVSFSGAVLATNVSMKVYIDFSTLEDTDNTNNQPTVVYSTGVESLTDYIPLLTAEQFTGSILGNYEADAGDETDAGETETDAAGIVHTETETLVDGILTVNETTTLGFDLTYTANTATFASTITGTYVASDGTTFTKVSAQATFNPTGGEDGEGNIEDAIGTALASTGESATFVSNSTNDGFVFTYTDSNNAVRVLTVTDDAVVISNTTTAEATTNTAPTLSDMTGHTAILTIDEDAAYTHDTSVHYADVDSGDTATYSLEGSSWATIDSSTGVITGTPNNDNVGTETVSVTVTDAAGLKATTSYDLTVNNTNDAATITVATDKTIAEGTTTVTGDASHTDVDANNTDDVFIAATDVASTYGTYSVDVAGAWTYSLNSDNATINALGEGQATADTITVTAEDGTTQDISIAITGTDDEPTTTAQLIQVRNVEAMSQKQASLNEFGSDVTSGSSDTVVKFELWLDTSELSALQGSPSEIRDFQFNIDFDATELQVHNWSGGYDITSNGVIGWATTNTSNMGLTWNPDTLVGAFSSSSAIVDTVPSPVPGVVPDSVPSEKLIATFYANPKDGIELVNMSITNINIGTELANSFDLNDMTFDMDTSTINATIQTDATHYLNNISINYVDDEGVDTGISSLVENGGITLEQSVDFDVVTLSDSNAYLSGVQTNDATAILRHIVGLDTLEDGSVNIHAADVNNNGTVQTNDATAVLRHIVGLDEIGTFDLVDNLTGQRVIHLDEDGASIASLTIVENGDVNQSGLFDDNYTVLTDLV